MDSHHQRISCFHASVQRSFWEVLTVSFLFFYSPPQIESNCFLVHVNILCCMKNCPIAREQLSSLLKKLFLKEYKILIKSFEIFSGQNYDKFPLRKAPHDEATLLLVFSRLSDRSMPKSVNSLST